MLLVVAAVAYYAGSVAGAATGFAAGFLLDLLTGATMGASSLVLTAVGYGVGRFREVRDPSHGLLPVPSARPPRRAGSWPSRPCRSCSTWARGQPAGDPRHGRGRSCSTRCWRSRCSPAAQAAAPSLASTPIEPPPPAAPRRPARSACGASEVCGDVPRQRPPPDAHPAAGRPGGGARRRSRCGLRDHLLPALVPPGALGRQVPSRGARATSCARSRCRRRAARSWTATGACWWTTAPASRSRSRPDKLPEDEAGRRELYRRLGGCWTCARARSSGVAEQLKELPFSTATVKQDVPRATRWCTCSSARRTSGVEVERVFLRKYPHGEIGAHLFGTVGEVTRGAARRRALPRRRARRPRRPVRDRVRVRPLPARPRTAPPACRSTRSATSRRRARGRRSPTREPAAPVARPRRPADRPGGARGRHRQGAFAVMNVHNGEVLALGSQPSFDPNLFAKVVRSPTTSGSPPRRTARRSPTARSQGGYPTGSTFKLITATAALETGLITPDDAAQRRRLAHRRRRGLQERGRRGARGARAAPGAHRVERRVLLPARPRHERAGTCSSAGRACSGSAGRPASTCPRSCPG